MCEDANSKLVEVVTVADVDAEKHVDDSWCRFESWSLVIKLNFCSDFEHKGWLRGCFVEVMKIILCRDSEARFGQDFGVLVKSKCWYLVEVLKLLLGRDYEDEI